MSTRTTIVYRDGPEFHFSLSEEIFENDALYLELWGPELQFEAGPGRVMVRIPVEVWEAIRHRAEADVRFADWSDEQIDEFVEREVDERIREYREYVEQTGDKDRLKRTFGCGLYGGADAPREQQVEAGREHFRELRDEHTSRKRRIKRLLARP
jgi:hypothetical protein